MTRTSDRTLRVLVVEDEADLLDLAAAMLRAAGHQVHQAHDAEAAIDLLAGGLAVDLVFTDIGLPGSSGLELAAAVAGTHPEISILFTTGQRDPEVQDQIRAAGRPLLPKPYTPDALRRAVYAAAGAAPPEEEASP